MNPLEMFLRKHAPEAVAVYDSRLNLLDANDSFYRFFPDCTEKSLSEMFSDMAGGEDFFAQMMTVVEVENGIGECTVARNSVGNRWEFRVNLIGYCEGDEKGYVCSFQDITEYLFVQKVLMHRSDSLERLDRNSPVGVFKAAVGGSILYVNEGLVSMLGYESEHQIFNLELSATWVDTDDRNSLLDSLKLNKVVNGFETRWKRRNGDVFWVSLTATAQQDRAGDLMYIEVVALDIDEKKRAENDLKRLQNRLQSIIDEKTNELKRANDLLLKEVAERQKAESIYAVLHAIAEETAKTVSLKSLLEFIHHQLSRIIHTPNLYFAFYNAQSDSYTFPYSIDSKDGVDTFVGSESMKGSLTEYVRTTGKPVLIDNEDYARMVEQGALRSIGSPSEQWMGVPLKDSEGVWGVLAVQSYDMKNVFSEKDLVLLAGLADSVSMAVGRFRAEQNRKRIESLYNTVVDNLLQGVIMCDPYDRIIFANEAFAKIVGIPAKQLEGTEFQSLIPERDKDKTANVREARTLGECSSYQISLIRSNGEPVPVSISGIPRFEDTGNFIGTVGLFDLIEEGEHLLE
jgi:PAS domain S-box-containing protein